MVGSILATVQMKRFGQPEEIAKTVLFLARADSSYITGVEVNVDGGSLTGFFHCDSTNFVPRETQAFRWRR